MNLNTMYFGVVDNFGIMEEYVRFDVARDAAKEIKADRTSGRFFSFVTREDGTLVRTDIFDGTVKLFESRHKMRDQILAKYMRQIVDGEISGKVGALAALRLLA